MSFQILAKKCFLRTIYFILYFTILIEKHKLFYMWIIGNYYIYQRKY